MRKHINYLFEGLFDDDIFDTDETIEDVVDLGSKIGIPTKLCYCSDINQINLYLMSKYNIDKVKNAILNITLDRPYDETIVRKSTWQNNVWNITVKPIEPDSTLPYFNLTLAKNDSYGIEGSPIIYRKLEIASPGYYLNLENQNNIKNLIMLLGNSITMTAPRLKVITQYNNDILMPLFDSTFENIIEYGFSKTLHTSRIVNELTCEPKIYKVVQKDYDRMVKCYATHQYAGFDAITKPEKMVARLAAILIVAYLKGAFDNIAMEFNDDLLIRIIVNDMQGSSSSTTYAKRQIRSIPEYLLVLERILKFPTIHLKDVLATYEAYKDKF